MITLIVLVLLLWLSHAGDMLTTFVALDRGCVEFNPVMASLSWGGMVAFKAGCILFVTGLILRYLYTSPRVAHALLWLGILAGTGAAVWNIYQLPLC